MQPTNMARRRFFKLDRAECGHGYGAYFSRLQTQTFSRLVATRCVALSAGKS